MHNRMENNIQTNNAFRIEWNCLESGKVNIINDWKTGEGNRMSRNPY